MSTVALPAARTPLLLEAPTKVSEPLKAEVTALAGMGSLAAADLGIAMLAPGFDEQLDQVRNAILGAPRGGTVSVPSFALAKFGSDMAAGLGKDIRFQVHGDPAKLLLERADQMLNAAKTRWARNPYSSGAFSTARLGAGFLGQKPNIADYARLGATIGLLGRD